MDIINPKLVLYSVQLLRRTSGAFDCDVCNIQLGSAAPYIAHLKVG